MQEIEVDKPKWISLDGREHFCQSFIFDNEQIKVDSQSSNLINYQDHSPVLGMVTSNGQYQLESHATEELLKFPV